MHVKVYVGSLMISYLASRPSRDLVIAARQALTAEWWSENHSRYELFISALVEDEIARGDPTAAAKRLEIAEGVPSLDVSDRAKDLGSYLNAGPFPQAVKRMHPISASLRQRACTICSPGISSKSTTPKPRRR